MASHYLLHNPKTKEIKNTTSKNVFKKFREIGYEYICTVNGFNCSFFKSDIKEE